MTLLRDLRIALVLAGLVALGVAGVGAGLMPVTPAVEVTK